MDKQIICVKASSHSNFELYLISEKYNISYNFLQECKSKPNLIKVWLDTKNENVLAVQEFTKNQDKVFIPYISMTISEIQKLYDLTPIICGKVIRKYRGDIDAKEKEFKQKLIDNDRYRKQMLERNYDPSDIYCINLNSTKEQLFALCIHYKINFLRVIDFLDMYESLKLHRLWIEKETSDYVAFSYLSESSNFKNENFEILEDVLIPRSAIYKMSHIPLKIPKLKITNESIEHYLLAKEKGYLLIEKFEFFLNSNQHDLFKIKSIYEDRIKELSNVEKKELLQEAVYEEDYEFAAFLRDHLKKYE